MAAKGLAKVYVSVTTLDRDLARRMEPRAPTPERRLEAIAAARRGRRAGRRDGRADRAGGQRRRDREDPGARLRRRRARGGLRDAAAAAGIARPVPRMAGRELPRQAQAHAVAGAIDARRQGLRVAMGPAHGGLRPLRLDDRPPVRDRRAQARLSREGLRAAHRPVQAAGAARPRGRGSCRCSEATSSRVWRSRDRRRRSRGARSASSRAAM